MSPPPAWLQGVWVRRGRAFEVDELIGGLSLAANRTTATKPQPPGATALASPLDTAKSAPLQVELTLPEMSDVVWIQCGDWFADLRVPRSTPSGDELHPLDSAQAFSGRLTYTSEAGSAHSGTHWADTSKSIEANPSLEEATTREQPPSDGVTSVASVTWWHDLDTQPRAPGHADSGVLQHHSGLMIESGPGYLEVWERQGQSLPGITVERRNPLNDALEARIVASGEWVVALWRQAYSETEPAASGAALGTGLSSPGPFESPLSGLALRRGPNATEQQWTVGSGEIPWNSIDAACAGRVAQSWTLARE